ncbi:molecular chaperone [Sphingomonas sp.]|uniref:fimbrial biogenesis chaperone n=1 Tax=Sphingomonas sp. TaxID=28214 RepID=UPI003AFFC7BB
MTGTAAGAQVLTILPVTISLPARQQAGIVTLVNSGQTDVSIQVRAFAWTQSADGSDRLESTDALAVSPPLATIPAGRKQIVRLVLRQPAQATEASYRILVDQIPGPAQGNEIRVALRSSLPVFVEPHASAAPRLRFGAEMTGGALYVFAVNDGKRHENIQNLTLRTAGGTSFSPTAGISPYILPGATRRWLVANAAV